MFDATNINWALYEDGTEFRGMPQATLPNITSITQTLTGAGIGGNVDTAVIGHIESMRLTLNFPTVTKQSIVLAEPRRHNIDLRAAVQDEDTVNGVIVVRAVKNIMVVEPVAHNPGNIAPAARSDGSGEYSVLSWAMYIDDEQTLDIDPLNMRFFVNGVDYLASVRKALGRQ